MMKKIIILCMFLIGISAFGQTKAEKIQELMKLTQVDKISLQMYTQIMDYYKKSFSDVPEKVWDDFLNEIDTGKMMKMYIPIYDKYYTEPEIDQLITFYKSPIGQKTIENMPALLKESMEVGTKYGREIGEKIVKKMEEEYNYQDPPMPMPSNEE
ncbi:DUF2059 domain-containing protein [Chryseobacterium sp. CT-SW4]|uniref:DUF2059 domain-containing protein n=1 Tax=Chryseobacterium sp. SW-1 TaxID=3157343 RepID=UPI003B01535D